MALHRHEFPAGTCAAMEPPCPAEPPAEYRIHDRLHGNAWHTAKPEERGLEYLSSESGGGGSCIYSSRRRFWSGSRDLQRRLAGVSVHANEAGKANHEGPLYIGCIYL